MKRAGGPRSLELEIEIAGGMRSFRTYFGMQSPPNEPKPPPTRTQIRPGLWLDSRLALWMETPRLLVIADLHWGYVASHRSRGNLLPWWGDDQIEERLRSLISDYSPAEMIWLGDVVHAAEGGARAEAFVGASPVPIALLAGNHDRRWRCARERTVTRGQFFFHHGNETPEVGATLTEVIGHHHPAFDWWDGAGSRLKIPALVSSPRRLILPAFSPWAAGTPWNHQLSRDDTLWAISPSRIFAARRGAAAPALVP